MICILLNKDYQSAIKLLPNRILLITVIQDLLFIESPINLQVLLHLAVSYREVSPDQKYHEVKFVEKRRNMQPNKGALSTHNRDEHVPHH